MEYIVIPKLNKILTERKLTQTKLSEMSKVPQSAISRFDKNKQHLDTHLIAISRALNISIEDLFDVQCITDEDLELMQRATKNAIEAKDIPKYDQFEVDLDETKPNKDIRYRTTSNGIYVDSE
jgi:putative transcriptional regulator